MSSSQPAQLYKIDHGRGEPTLVFLHGTAGDHDDFSIQVRAFESKYRVIAFDLRGHGKSPKPATGYTVPELASDIAAELFRLKPPPQSVIVIGHSLGGLVALELASQGTESLCGVVLVDAPMLIPPAIAAAIAPYGEAFQGIQYKEKLEEFANSFYFSPADDPVRKKFLINRLLDFPHERFIQLWDATGCYDAETAVKRCRLPALYIHASVPADFDKLRSLSSVFCIAETERPSHYAQFECAEQVNVLIHDFILKR